MDWYYRRIVITTCVCIAHAEDTRFKPGICDAPKDFSVMTLLSTESERLLWKGEGLPSDALRWVTNT